MDGYSGTGWSIGRINLDLSERMQLFIIADYKDQGGSCSLDDIALLPEECPGFSAGCSFDRDLCGYAGYPEKDTEWLVGRGFTKNPDIISGPFEDHTSSNGLYAYVDYTYSNFEEGKISNKLYSETIDSNPDDVFCFSFWWIKFASGDSNFNVLTVYREVYNVLKDNEVLWKSNSDSQSKSWMFANINITRSEQNYKLIFESTAYKNSSFAAIDDAWLSKGDCTIAPPPTIAPPFPGTCRFEDESICGFMQDTQDDCDWNLGQSGNSPDLPSDHTINSHEGFFVYMNSSRLSDGSIGRLISPEISLSQACISLYYVISNPENLLLKLYIRYYDAPNDPILLVELSSPFSSWVATR